MIEIYAWNTKIFKNWGYRYTKSKIDWDFTSCWTKKNQGQGIIKQFSSCLLRLWAEKINGNKKNFDEGE